MQHSFSPFYFLSGIEKRRKKRLWRLSREALASAACVDEDCAAADAAAAAADAAFVVAASYGQSASWRRRNLDRYCSYHKKDSREDEERFDQFDLETRRHDAGELVDALDAAESNIAIERQSFEA